MLSDTVQIGVKIDYLCGIYTKSAFHLGFQCFVLPIESVKSLGCLVTVFPLYSAFLTVTIHNPDRTYRHSSCSSGNCQGLFLASV